MNWLFLIQVKPIYSPESVDTIKNIAPGIIGWNIEYVKMVCIEGHTDVSTDDVKRIHDNWDLSTRRATNTLRLILDTGYIEPDKLSAMGYGEYRPIDTNDTPEGRADNRRVDIILEKTIHKIAKGNKDEIK